MTIAIISLDNPLMPMRTLLEKISGPNSYYENLHFSAWRWKNNFTKVGTGEICIDDKCVVKLNFV